MKKIFKHILILTCIIINSSYSLDYQLIDFHVHQIDERAQSKWGYGTIIQTIDQSGNSFEEKADKHLLISDSYRIKPFNKDSRYNEDIRDHLNEILEEKHLENPDNVLGICGINIEWKDYLQKVHDCFMLSGMVGIKLHLESDGGYLYTNSKRKKRFRKLSSMVNKKAGILLIHFETTYHFHEQNYNLNQGIKEEIEFLIDTAVINPDAKFIIAHSGEKSSIGFDGLRIIGKYFNDNPGIEKNIYLDTSGDFPVNQDVIESWEEFGFDRVLFGSDYPAYIYNDQVVRISESNLLNDNQKRKILRNNGLKLFIKLQNNFSPIEIIEYDNFNLLHKRISICDSAQQYCYFTYDITFELPFNNEAIEEIIQVFAGPRDFNEMKDNLLSLIKIEKGKIRKNKMIKFSIKNILPSMPKKRLNSFPTNEVLDGNQEDGPNCHHTTSHFWADDVVLPNYGFYPNQNTGITLKRMVDMYYDRISIVNIQDLKFGDVIYKKINDRGNPKKHTVTYLNNGFVFSKGKGQSNYPWIISTLEEEIDYKNPIDLIVFRPNTIPVWSEDLIKPLEKSEFKCDMCTDDDMFELEFRRYLEQELEKKRQTDQIK
ncbi:MAG: hypothetical protein ABIA04_16460 [Pseudomonadota bacterium]